MYFGWFIFILCFYSSSAIIYHLNESEYTRMPPLYGLDDYVRCLAPRNGTYCMIRLDLSAEKDDSLMQLIHEYSEWKLKHYNHSYLQRGICVTSTCKHHIHNHHNLYSEEDLVDILEACQNETIYNEFGLQAKLTELYYCERKDQPMDVDLADWVVMGAFIGIILINIAGSLYDVIITRSGEAIKGNPYILSFSLIQNWKRLVSTESEEMRKRRLTGLHGVRVLTIFLMFTAHILWINTIGFNDNIQEFEEMYESPYFMLILNGLIVIQVFFVMSGFLLVYNLKVHEEKHDVSWTLAVKVWFLRWIRLTPAYAVVIAFMSTWLRHVGSGPLWRLVVADSVVSDCRRYWWAHLLYINNYVPDGPYCAVHTWHIAADTQLFCIGLAAYFLTRRGGRRGVLALLMLLGAALPAVHVWAWDLDALVLSDPEFYRTMVNDTFHYMHVHGHINLVSYAAGMAAACLVYRLQNKGTQLGNNKVCIALAWLVIPLVVCVFYSGSAFYSPVRCARWARALYAALHRPVVAAAVVYGIIALTLRLKTVLRAILEHGAWVVPSRLSYAVYLLHAALIYAHIGLRTQLGHASNYNMTLMHFGVMSMTYLIALPFSLMVEAPFMRLVKILAADRRKEQTNL